MSVPPENEPPSEAPKAAPRNEPTDATGTSFIPEPEVGGESAAQESQQSQASNMGLSKPAQNSAALLKELMEKLFAAVKEADVDPQSRRKMNVLDLNTQKAHDSNSENAAGFLMKKYQESPGLQKLVDSGLDFAEKIAQKFAPKEMLNDITKVFGDARKLLSGLKKSGPKPSPDDSSETSAEADANTTPKPELTASEPEPSNVTNQSPELTPPLHKVLDIYQQIVKLLRELFEGPSKDKEQQKQIGLRMGQGMSMNFDQETINSALDQMKDLYKNSPTMQKIVDTGLNFAERIALKFTPSQYKDEVKKGFEQVRGTFKEWKQEAAQERQANPNAQPDLAAGPVKVALKQIKPGTVEPIADKPLVEPSVKKSSAPRPKGPGFFAQNIQEQDKDEKKKAEEEAAAALSRASKRGEGTRDIPKLQTPDQQQ